MGIRTVRLPDFSTNAIYHDANQFEVEMDRLFLNNWILVGMADQVAEPDTWFVHDGYNRSLIISRDSKGDLHGLINSCTHRGTRICKSGAAGNGRMRCPYHSWVFDTGGQLMGVHSRSGFAPFENRDYALHRVSVEQVGQFLFAHSSERPETSLKEALGEQYGRLEQLLPPGAAFVHAESFEIHANWKFCVAGAVEAYHQPAVHGQSFNRRKKDGVQPELRSGGHSAFTARRLNLLKQEQDFSNDLLFPNTVAIKTGPYLHVTSCTPWSADLTVHFSRVYDCFGKRQTARKLVFGLVGLRAVRRAYLEDKLAVEEVHRGTKIAQFMKRGPCHDEEVRVDHFLAEIGRRTNHTAARSVSTGG